MPLTPSRQPKVGERSRGVARRETKEDRDRLTARGNSLDPPENRPDNQLDVIINVWERVRVLEAFRNRKA